MLLSAAILLFASNGLQLVGILAREQSILMGIGSSLYLLTALFLLFSKIKRLRFFYNSIEEEGPV